MPPKKTQDIKKMEDTKKNSKTKIHLTKTPTRFKDYPVDSKTPWSKAQPSTTVQRRELLGVCGSSCFMDPVSLKFPVCNKVSTTSSKSKCVYNERAIKRAVPSRAGEWKYPDVMKADKKLEEKLVKMKKTRQ
jgi:hypothetical protein